MKSKQIQFTIVIRITENRNTAKVHTEAAERTVFFGISARKIPPTDVRINQIDVD